MRHGGQLLGVLRLQERPGLALTSVEEGLFTGLSRPRQGWCCDWSASVPSSLRLVHRVADEGTGAESVPPAADRGPGCRTAPPGARHPRACATAPGGARWSNLRLAETVAARAPERAARLLGEQAVATRVAIETLSELSRGIYPRVLADEARSPALRAAVATSAVPVTIIDEQIGRPAADRWRRLCTSAAMEAVQNAAKHSAASSVLIQVRRGPGLLAALRRGRRERLRPGSSEGRRSW